MKYTQRSRKRILIMKMAAPLLCGLFFYCLLQFVFLIGYVPTASMEPTIRENSWIVGVRLLGELQRGDIVIFRYQDALLVKRVAGIPGDTVYISDQTGSPKIEKADDAMCAAIVPEGCYYLLGDNPSESFDSRLWQEPFIPETDIVAKLLW